MLRYFIYFMVAIEISFESIQFLTSLQNVNFSIPDSEQIPWLFVDIENFPVTLICPELVPLRAPFS